MVCLYTFLIIAAGSGIRNVASTVTWCQGAVGSLDVASERGVTCSQGAREPRDVAGRASKRGAAHKDACHRGIWC